jgi:hypothetical protein
MAAKAYADGDPTNGDQAFTFIGAGAITGPGQISHFTNLGGIDLADFLDGNDDNYGDDGDDNIYGKAGNGRYDLHPA